MHVLVFGKNVNSLRLCLTGIQQIEIKSKRKNSTPYPDRVNILVFLHCLENYKEIDK